MEAKASEGEKAALATSCGMKSAAFHTDVLGELWADLVVGGFFAVDEGEDGDADHEQRRDGEDGVVGDGGGEAGGAVFEPFVEGGFEDFPCGHGVAFGGRWGGFGGHGGLLGCDRSVGDARGVPERVIESFGIKVDFRIEKPEWSAGPSEEFEDKG